MPLTKGSARCLLVLACAAQAEALPPLRVNGVAVQVTRLEGVDLAARVQAIEAAWRTPGASVSPWREEGPWRVLSRRVGPWSEVLQLRRDGPLPEAFLSRMDTRQRPAVVPVLPLPPGCRVNSTVESTDSGGRVIQATGPCRGADRADANAWASALAAQGWRTESRGSQGVWRFQRRGELLQVLRGPSWVMALQVTSTAGTQ